MFFNQWDAGSILVVTVVLGFLGEGVIHLTARMTSLKQWIRSWAVGLGIVTGIFFFFAVFSPRNASNPDGVLSSIFQAMLMGFCAGLVWYLAVAIVTFIFQHVIAPPFRAMNRWRLSSSEERSRRRYARQRQLDAESAAADRSWAAATRATEQKRRNDARAACELLYHKHAHVLANRFPREALDGFMNKFMTDSQSPDEVEERGRQLQELILQHVQDIEPPQKPYTIESLAEWYRRTKELIEKLPLDSRYRQAQMAQLNARYAELMQDLMEALRP